MTRVIHTGDTHLGYRQYHRTERREDFLEAFRTVLEDAVADDVDAVVHAGDLFHDRQPGLPDLLGAISVLETLDDADIPLLAVVGNHESKRDAQWLDLFETMGLATRLGRDPVVVGDTAFYGLDFVPRTRREDLEYDFEAHAAAHAALVSHGRFAPVVPDYGRVEWDAREVLDAASVDFDAMLLGDEHAPTRQRIDDTWVTYCGSTERASADERDERGYNIVEFDDAVHIGRRGIETREFVFLDLELDSGEGADRVQDRLREHDLEGAVVHVSISGDGDSVPAARIESAAADEGALVARVNDRRERREAGDHDVAFADPDDAVRDRVRELGLSEAARDLDETIRASTVADANVADEVERRVAELLDEPAAFTGSDPDEADPVEDSTDPDTVAEDRGTDATEGTTADGSDPTAEPAVAAVQEDDTVESADTGRDGVEAVDGTAADGDSTAEDAERAVDDVDRSTEPDEPTADGRESAAEADSDGEDQASMEDYL